MNIEGNFKPKNWLEHLRNNSWEMELLITGFVLVGLFQVPDLLIGFKDMLASQVVSNFMRNSVGAIWRMLDTSVKVIILNLVLLLILRGYWIGLIGLDSTIHNKDAKARERKLIKSIRKLDDVCSIIFALTFLIVFITIASSIYMIYWSLLAVIIGFYVPSYLVVPYRVVTIFAFSLFSVVGILKVTDFLTLGRIKAIRSKWFALPFNFLSRWVEYLTLGFLSRQIYSFLMKSIPRKRFRLILVAYIFVIIVIFTGIQVENRVYFPFAGSKLMINPAEYQHLAYHDSSTRDESAVKGLFPTIQSELVTDPYLRLYIPYTVMDNENIAVSIPDIKPFHSGVVMEYISFGRDETIPFQKKVLDYYKGIYSISIDDSVQCNCDFRFYHYPEEKEIGILTYIPLGKLPNGLHELKIFYRERGYTREIPFWLMREECE